MGYCIRNCLDLGDLQGDSSDKVICWSKAKVVVYNYRSVDSHKFVNHTYITKIRIIGTHTKGLAGGCEFS